MSRLTQLIRDLNWGLLWLKSPGCYELCQHRNDDQPQQSKRPRKISAESQICWPNWQLSTAPGFLPNTPQTKFTISPLSTKYSSCACSVQWKAPLSHSDASIQDTASILPLSPEAWQIDLLNISHTCSSLPIHPFCCSQSTGPHHLAQMNASALGLSFLPMPCSYWVCGPPWNQSTFQNAKPISHHPPHRAQFLMWITRPCVILPSLSSTDRPSPPTPLSPQSRASPSHALESLLLPLPCSFLLLSLGTCQSLHLVCSPPPPMNSWLQLAPRLDHTPSGTPCSLRPGWLLLHVPTTLCAFPIRILTALSCTHSLAVLCISPEAVHFQWPHPHPSS